MAFLRCRFLCFLKFFFILSLSHFNVADARTYASIVMEAGSGNVLHQVNADQVVYPASLTKMMTLYLVFQALEQKKLSLNQWLKVSRQAQRQQPTKLGLKKGEKIMVKQAILGLVTKSANDAAVALAENLGKTEAQFAILMTKTAKKIGLHHTTFRNASGLPDRSQKTTARDMALLAQALYKHFPKYCAYFKKEVFEFRGVAHKNHNHLLGKVHGVDGIKTGFINASGYNLAASAVRNNKRLIVVVMGGETRKWRDHHITQLIDTAYQAPHHLPIVTARLSPLKQSLQIPDLLSRAHAAELLPEDNMSISTLIQASAEKPILAKKQKSPRRKKRRSLKKNRIKV